MQKGGDGGSSVATGCFKCGRPGHWSRDCPSGNTASPAAGLNSSSKLFEGGKSPFEGKEKAEGAGSSNSSAKSKKPPRTRPKLTPELLLSDDGIGFVLRHFPRTFKSRGRGHEVEDLGRLIDLYADWHSRLIPYYSFNQFVHKVEQVGASKRVRRCIDELRQRIANGGDPTKLHEPPTALSPSPDHDPEEDGIARQTSPKPENLDPSKEVDDTNDNQENMINEIYHTATEEPSQPISSPEDGLRATDSGVSEGQPEKSEVQITEEQRARMEANRLKALERAVERARSLLPELAQVDL